MKVHPGGWVVRLSEKMANYLMLSLAKTTINSCHYNLAVTAKGSACTLLGPKIRSTKN
jgi:hypothetical protein